jgi:hypothetical protein
MEKVTAGLMFWTDHLERVCFTLYSLAPFPPTGCTVQPLQQPQQRIGAGAVKGASPIRVTVEPGDAGRHVMDAAVLHPPAVRSESDAREHVAAVLSVVRRATSVEAERCTPFNCIRPQPPRHGRW